MLQIFMDEVSMKYETAPDLWHRMYDVYKPSLERSKKDKVYACFFRI